MSVREELIEIQKRLVKRLKSEIYADYCSQNPEIDKYYNDYKRLTGHYERIATKQELIEAVLNSDIVYLGDYHALKQSQQTLIRILEALPKYSRRIILGLEMVQCKSQDILDRYMNNRIDEKSFLESINYEKTWGFNWNNYKAIIDYAREHKIKVIALNSEPISSSKGEKITSLYRRDAAAAKIITETLSKNPKWLFIALFGDLHISEKHLPSQVDNILIKNKLPLPKKLIICQNSERIYWQLAETGEEQTIDVVKIKDNVYCVMNSTPLTVFQSCLQWYNSEKELKTCLIHRNWCDKDISTSFLEEVVQLVKVICHFLDLEVPMVTDLTVCTAHDFELLKHIKKETLSPQEAKRFEIDLLKTESYFIERNDIICLANFSLNHAAEQSAHFIHHYYIKDKLKSITRSPMSIGGRNKQDDFYYTVLREALGFLGSKIINHKRMCYKELDFEELLTQRKWRRSAMATHRKITLPRLKELKEIAEFVVEHKKRERDYLNNSVWEAYKKISYLSLEEFIGISHALGYILGDKIYEGILQGKINRSEIRELFLNPFDVKDEPLNKYLYLIRSVQGVKETYLRKADHL
ncbi:MAG: ChaN family lipoprotein [Planctomycetota bacterium]